MTKIVSYYGERGYNLLQWVKDLDHPNVVKKTISYISNSITAEVVKASQSVAHVFSGSIPTEMFEGQTARIIMDTPCKEFAERAWERLEQHLTVNDGQFELLLIISKDRRFGLALIDYISPENWYR